MNSDAEKIIRNQICDHINAGHADAARNLLVAHPELISKPASFPWLWEAAHAGNIDVVKMLLDVGCDPNDAGNKSVRSAPLSTAIGKDNPQMAQMLLESGADPNADRNVIGAVTGNKKQSLKLIQLLERFGADLNRQFPMGDKQINALSMAKVYGKQDVVEYLLSKGATMPPVDGTTSR